MGLLKQQQQQRQQGVGAVLDAPQQQQQQQVCPAVLQLIVRYLEAAPAAAGDKAPTLLFLLTALTNALKIAAARTDSTPSSSSSSSSSSGCDSSGVWDGKRLAALLRVLAHVEFAQPSHMRPQLCSAVLQLVPLCLKVGGPFRILTLRLSTKHWVCSVWNQRMVLCVNGCLGWRWGSGKRGFS
jgi:hypothetical protein